MVKITGSPQLC